MRVVAVPEPAALGSPRWGFCDLVLGSLVEFDADALRSLEGGRPPLPGAGTTAVSHRVLRPDRPDRGPWSTAIGCSRLQNADPTSVDRGAAPMNPSRGAFPRAGGPGDVGPVPVGRPDGPRHCRHLGERQAVEGPPSGPSGLDCPPGGAGSVRPWTPDRHVTHLRRRSGSASWPRAAAPSSRPSWPTDLPVRLVAADRPCRALEVAAAASVPRSWSTGPTTAASAPGSTGRVHPGAGRRPRRPPTSTWWSWPASAPCSSSRSTTPSPDRILNTHPALLPDFPGWHAVHDALAAGVARDGHHRPRGAPGDGHRADPGPGHGGRSSRTTPRRRLHERIKAVERTLYPATIRTFIDGLAAQAVGGGPSPEEVTE